MCSPCQSTNFTRCDFHIHESARSTSYDHAYVVGHSAPPGMSLCFVLLFGIPVSLTFHFYFPAITNIVSRINESLGALRANAELHTLLSFTYNENFQSLFDIFAGGASRDLDGWLESICARKEDALLLRNTFVSMRLIAIEDGRLEIPPKVMERVHARLGAPVASTAGPVDTASVAEGSGA